MAEDKKKKKGVIARALGGDFGSLGEKTKKRRQEIRKKNASNTLGAKKTRDDTKKSHTSLLTNDGKGTPRPKVKKVGVGKVGAQPETGPKNREVKKIPRVKRAKTTALKSPKKSGVKLDTKPTATPIKKDSGTTLKFKKSRRQRRQEKGALKASNKADKGAKDGSITKKKYNRLNRRATRKAERAAGTRKTAVGTAITKVGRGLHSAGHAYATFEKKKFKTAAHKKKKK